MIFRGARFWLMVWLVAPSLARGGEARDAYILNQFAKVPAAALRDFKKGHLDDNAIGSIVEMSAESFAVEPGMPLSEYLLVLESAKPLFGTRRLDEGIDLERKALLKWIPRERELGVEQVARAILQAEKLPIRTSTEIRIRSRELMALSLLSRRKVEGVKGDASDPEWLYLAGRALAGFKGGGDAYLKRYLAFPDKKRLKHAKEARELLKKLNEDQG